MEKAQKLQSIFYLGIKWISEKHVALQFIYHILRILELIFILRQKDMISLCCLQPYPVEYRPKKDLYIELVTGKAELLFDLIKNTQK